MPEIMSAEDVFHFIRPYRPIGVPKWNMADPPDANECIAAIESRDSAILEKYKAAICKVCRYSCRDETVNDCAWKTTLDSAFAEIEGGK